jgi:hypothetical protein
VPDVAKDGRTWHLGTSGEVAWIKDGTSVGMTISAGIPLVFEALPDLMFPADRSWLVNTRWDDSWSCVGGPARLVADLLRHPDLEARQVTPGEDATPPGHKAF